MRSLKRICHVFLLLAVIAPLGGWAANATAQGYVVRSWQSPTYGFTVEYRTDAFFFGSEESTSGVDILVLNSEVGWFSIEAMPATMTVNQCVQAMVDEVAQSDGNHEIPLFTENGSALIRSTMLDSAGRYTDYTRRIDCIMAADGAYLVRFMHFATTADHGMWETAARDIRASYKPGYPANNPLPPNVTDPDGELEVAILPLWYVYAPPADLDALYQPMILLTVEIIVNSVSTMDSLLETGRIIIPGVGRSISHVWISNGTLYPDEEIIVSPGTGVVGHLTFAIPAASTKVTFCYQHVTNNNCTDLGQYELGAVYGGGPNTRPRINPGT